MNVRPDRLAMMMFGGSPIRVAVPPMLEAITSAIRNGAGRQPEPVADQKRHRRDQQDGGDVVQPAEATAVMTHQDDHHRVRAGRGRA